MLVFAHPWVFAALVLPALVYFLVPARRLPVRSVRVPFLHRLSAANRKHPVAKNAGRATAWGVRVVVYALVVVALARPQWLEKPIRRTVPTRDLLVLVDLSSSMDHKDFTNEDGKQVDRLTALKEVLGDFLARRKGDRVGLVVFGNAPFLQVPLTTDLALCDQLLDETRVGMAGPKTALGDAIGLAIQLFQESDSPEKTVIALTDGNDTSSAVPPVEAARVARDREITIHTIAMGDPKTVGEEALDETSLRKVAESTGGKFFLAIDTDQLENVYQTIDSIETSEAKTVSHRPRKDIYFVPLAAALSLSVLSSLISAVSRLTPKQSTSQVRLRVNARTFEMESTSEMEPVRR